LKRKDISQKEATPAQGRTRTLTPGKKREKPEHGTSLLTAFQEIRELIVHGKISPGTWIVEADLAERLNLSRPYVPQFTGCSAKVTCWSIAM